MENTNNKPRTIDEFFIEKYQKLEEENKVLEERQEKLLEINNNLGDERDEWKAKYNELINKLKEDFKPNLSKSMYDDFYGIYFSSVSVYNAFKQEEKYEYYKNVFNLKEEGEEENEQ